jgi:hypothetical protein
MRLSEDEIAFAQAIVDGLDAGKYTIKDMFGPDYYGFIIDPTKHGERFKESVELGQLNNIRLFEERHHVWYYSIKHG